MKDETISKYTPGLSRGTYILGQLSGLLIATVEDVLVVVHPDLRQSDLVAGDHLCAFGERVGALGAKNVTNNGAWDDLQLSAALPHLSVNGRRRKRMT